MENKPTMIAQDFLCLLCHSYENEIAHEAMQIRKQTFWGEHVLTSFTVFDVMCRLKASNQVCKTVKVCLINHD